MAVCQAPVRIVNEGLLRLAASTGRLRSAAVRWAKFPARQSVAELLVSVDRGGRTPGAPVQHVQARLPATIPLRTHNHPFHRRKLKAKRSVSSPLFFFPCLFSVLSWRDIGGAMDMSCGVDDNAVFIIRHSPYHYGGPGLVGQGSLGWN